MSIQFLLFLASLFIFFPFLFAYAFEAQLVVRVCLIFDLTAIGDRYHPEQRGRKGLICLGLNTIGSGSPLIVTHTQSTDTRPTV